MKIRTGFVSNSSSSSFIIATNGKAKGKITITMEVDIKDYAYETIKTVKALKEYFYENYGWEEGDDDSWVSEQFDKSKDAINRGKIVYAGSFSDEGTETVETLLCNEGLKDFVSDDDDIEIIHSEGGY